MSRPWESGLGILLQGKLQRGADQPSQPAGFGHEAQGQRGKMTVDQGEGFLPSHCVLERAVASVPLPRACEGHLKGGREGRRDVLFKNMGVELVKGRRCQSITLCRCDADVYLSPRLVA